MCFAKSRDLLKVLQVSYCSRSGRRRFTVYCTCILYCSAFITIFSDICTAHVHLRRNGYFWTCGVNLDTNMVGYVTNLATKFQHPTPIRSWFMTYNVSHWLPLKMHLQPLRMRRITLLVSMGSNPWPRFAYSLYNFYGATTMIKGPLLSSVPNAKAVDGIISCTWPCNLDLWPFDLEQL